MTERAALLADVISTARTVYLARTVPQFRLGEAFDSAFAAGDHAASLAMSAALCHVANRGHENDPDDVQTERWYQLQDMLSNDIAAFREKCRRRVSVDW